MGNKILIILSIPELDETYDLMVPLSRKVGNLIELIAKMLNELTNGEYEVDKYKGLYNSDNGEKYNNDSLIYNTDIRNGSKVILM